MSDRIGISPFAPPKYSDLHFQNTSIGKRKIKYHAGPTNSGKTHGALNLLAEHGGAYLAPLRLLALEVYENMLSRGENARLVTGEEKQGVEEAKITSSTIEMLDRNKSYRVVVIDEMQMCFDSSRGAAWVDAFFGANCDLLIMCGSQEGAEAAQMLASLTGEEIEVVAFERKSPLRIEDSITRNDELRPGTALVAFSKKDVLRIRDTLMRLGRTVAIIYGALGPEVRREEARRFREGEAEILVATDAIGMGLNLPIKKIVFTNHLKFDGREERTLSRDEVLQIAGRAGRYGMFEEGLVSATNMNTLMHIAETYNSEAEQMRPVKIFMQIEQIKSYMAATNAPFAKSVRHLRKVNLGLIPGSEPVRDEVIEIAEILDQVDGLSVDDKFRLMFAPVERGDRTQQAFLIYANSVGNRETVRAPVFDWTASDSVHKLKGLETQYQISSLYRWMSQRYPELFVEIEVANMQIKLGNLAITEMLKMKLAKTCESCNSLLPPSWPHRMCDECHYSDRWQS